MTPADAVIRAARIRTLDPRNPLATAIAVGAGRILAVGDADVEVLRGPDTVVHDYGDAVITPGLTDSHTHVVFGVGASRGIRLTDVGPLAEVQRIVGEAALAAGPGEWVLGWGLDPNLFTGIGFGGRVFDEASGAVPVYLRMRDGHSAVANSAALRLAGVTGAERFADEALVAVDDDGRPTGYLRELSAMEAVASAIPAEAFAERVDRLGGVLHEMAATGLCATHVLDLEGDAIRLVEALEARGELPLRLRFSPMLSAGADRDELEQVLALQGAGGRRWSIEGVKFMIDGTVDNGSAWLERPDAYGQGTDSVWTDPGAYVEALRFFAERGIPTATHAIGDQGVRFVLDALEGLGEVRGLAAHRIEHIETIPDELVGRFAELGVAASMQPVHGTHHTRADRSDNWSVRLGEERAAHGWRCRDLRESGAVVALGSDWPITPFDPRAMMADSILRRPVERLELAPVQPEQALTPEQALEGYTTHSARSAGLFEIVGSITAGKRADLTVWSRDPLEVDAEQLARTPIVATLLGGVPVEARVGVA